MSAPVTAPEHPALPTPGHRVIAEGMEDLTLRLRAWLGLEEQRPVRMPLGGSMFDVVITAAGDESRAAMAAMDAIQGNGCGPVIEDSARDGWMESGLMYWLVPPGSAQRWTSHPHAVCLGAPYTLTLPVLTRVAPPGPYWLRPCVSDRLVPVGPLREVLSRYRPGPVPRALIDAVAVRATGAESPPAI